MKKVLATAAIAASLVAAGAAPASATFNTGVLVGTSLVSAGRLAGVCMTYGAVPVVTVKDPLHPGMDLAIVSVPVVTSVKVC